MVWEDDEEQELESEDSLIERCNLCFAEIFGEEYVCDRCDALLCPACAVPAIDEESNMVMLCKNCAGEHNYGTDS